IAIEDTFVDSERPNTNFGQAAAIETDARPGTKRILVRFSVGPFSNGAAPTSAEPRLYVTDSAVEGGDVHAVEGSWSEAATAWSNAPAVGRRLASLTKPVTSGQWAEADVTSAVQSSGVVDFYVLTTRSDGVDYRSTE